MPRVTVSVREPVTGIEGFGELVAGLRALGDEFEVEVAENPYEGYAVTWGQLFSLVVDETSRHALDVIEAVFVAWAVKVLRRGKGKGHVNPRPRFLTMYGPDGKPLKRIVVRDPDEPPEDQTEDMERQARMLEEAKRQAAENIRSDS